MPPLRHDAADPEEAALGLPSDSGLERREAGVTKIRYERDERDERYERDLVSEGKKRSNI